MVRKILILGSQRKPENNQRFINNRMLLPDSRESIRYYSEATYVAREFIPDRRRNHFNRISNQFHSTRTDDDQSFNARDKLPVFRQTLLQKVKKINKIKKLRKTSYATLIHVSGRSNGVACRRNTGIHDISICKSRKRFIAIFFFLLFSAFFSIAVSRRVYREFCADTPGKTVIPR